MNVFDNATGSFAILVRFYQSKTYNVMRHENVGYRYAAARTNTGQPTQHCVLLPMIQLVTAIVSQRGTKGLGWQMMISKIKREAGSLIRDRQGP
jgi:hypothetical protein